MIEQIKSALLHTNKPTMSKKYLSCSSTLLNLACTNTTQGAWPLGSVVLFVGDSDSGKTWIALASLAEAANRKLFDDYRLIFDNAENGALMDMERYFGKRLRKRLEPPRVDENGKAVYSKTVEDFYDNVDDAVEDGRKFVYVLDSENALGSRSEEKLRKKNKARRQKGAKEGDTYGTEKAKAHAKNLNRVASALARTKSILIIISQTRDKIGATGFGPRKTRSGGRALAFYAHIQVWSATKEEIKSKEIRGKKRQQGIKSLCQVKRSRVTGKKRSVEIPIYHSVGVDDVGSCIDYLVEEKYWSKTQGKIKAKDFKFVGFKDELVKHVEENELEPDLQRLVGKIWNEIEEATKIERKKRYE
jgi:RecA/RadA recombinase